MALTELKAAFLDTLVKKGALRIAPDVNSLFVLKSGRKSPVFVNMGALTDGKALVGVKKAYAGMIAELVEGGKMQMPDFIFGPAYKGISIACLACEGLQELHHTNVRYLYDRKEEKAYGDKAMDQLIVGAGYFKAGDKVLLVDDVTTTGVTKLESMEKLNALGKYRLVGMVLAVDRQEKLGDIDKVDDITAVQSIERLGIKVFSILTMQDIYALVKDTVKPEMRACWQDYFKKYGAARLG